MYDYTHFLYNHKTSFTDFKIIKENDNQHIYYYETKVFNWLIFSPIIKFISIKEIFPEKNMFKQVYFNINTKTQTGFIKIARKYNLNLVPVKNIRNKKNNFTITFCQPIKLNNKNLSDSESMLVIHKILEKWILEFPTLWLWLLNRFN